MHQDRSGAPLARRELLNRHAYVIGPSVFATTRALTNGKIVLALLLRGRKGEPSATPRQVPVARSQPFPQLADPDAAPDACSKLAYRNAVPKRRPKPVQIARLYPQRPSEPLRHARALIELIQEECPDFVGFYVPKSDLERTYRELCAAKSWEAHHWTAIARRLQDLTKKRELKRSGTRFVAYQIPPTQFRSRSAS